MNLFLFNIIRQKTDEFKNFYKKSVFKTNEYKSGYENRLPDGPLRQPVVIQSRGVRFLKPL